MDKSMQDEEFQLARKRKALELRAGLIQNIRLYFISHDFLEVETPIRIPAPAPEEHIEALPAGDWFLQTSPELCMKRLLAAGYHRLFQISKCFRAGERGSLHLPEFTMLEWYVAGFDYQQLMDQCEAMIKAVAGDLSYGNHGYESQSELRGIIPIPKQDNSLYDFPRTMFRKIKGSLPSAARDCSTYQSRCVAHTELEFHNKITWQGRTINLAAPWERITVQEAFKKYAPVTVEQALIENKFDEILTGYVEPNLGHDKPTFLSDYPAKLGALARLKTSNQSVAERFELYIGGIELANGFSELTDVQEQRQRFREAQKLRAQKSYAAYPMPEKFLAALEQMPASAGIALGIDRLTMIFADKTNIDDVITFPPENL